MKQQDRNYQQQHQQHEENDNSTLREQKTGIHSPDAIDAAEENIQESTYLHRSYASPDFFKKKPHL